MIICHCYLGRLQAHMPDVHWATRGELRREMFGQIAFVSSLASNRLVLLHLWQSFVETTLVTLCQRDLSSGLQIAKMRHRQMS